MIRRIGTVLSISTHVRATAHCGYHHRGPRPLNKNRFEGNSGDPRYVSQSKPGRFRMLRSSSWSVLSLPLWVGIIACATLNDSRLPNCEPIEALPALPDTACMEDGQTAEYRDRLRNAIGSDAGPVLVRAMDLVDPWGPRGPTEYTRSFGLAVSSKFFFSLPTNRSLKYKWNDH